MDKSMKRIEMLTKKGKSFKNPKYAIVTEYLFVQELWDEIKEYLIIFNPRMTMYKYKFSQYVDIPNYDEDDDDDEETSIRTIEFTVFKFGLFDSNAEYNFVIQQVSDETHMGHMREYPISSKLIHKNINEFNIQLGYINHRNYLNDERGPLTIQDMDDGLESLNNDNKWKYEFMTWRDNITDKIDYKCLKQVLKDNKQYHRLKDVDDYLRGLLHKLYNF